MKLRNKTDHIHGTDFYNDFIEESKIKPYDNPIVDDHSLIWIWDAAIRLRRNLKALCN